MIVKPARGSFPVWESLAVMVVISAFVYNAYEQGLEAQRDQPYFDTQSTYDAGPGGYRGLFEVLQREGVDVQRFERHAAFLDDSVAVYVLADVGANPTRPTSPLAGADIEAASAWVNNGGRLVLIGGDYGADPALKTPAMADAGGKRDRARPVVATPLAQEVRSLAGTSSNRIPLARSLGQTPIVADRAGIVVASYPLGKGRVIVITDPTLFQNRNLAHADNARLAFDVMTAGLGTRPVVAFDESSHGYQLGETLWSVLPQPVQAALLIVCAALFVLLVATFFRFGPVALLPVDTERTSAEYLASMAALLARGGATRKALRDLADAAIRDLAASLGVYDGVSVALLAERLHSRAGGAALADALLELNRLRSYEYPKDADLLEAARISAILRKEYAPNARIGFGRRRTPAKRSA